MGALVRAELLTELLARTSADLLAALGWHGTAVVFLATVVFRALHTSRTPNADDAAAGRPGVHLACVTTVLLALLLLGGAG